MINYDLNKIKLLAFDIDGVLSASTIPVGDDGQPMRTANIKDGYAIHLALKLGMPVAIITGGTHEPVRRRYESLGSQDVHLGCSNKMETYLALLQKYGIKDENVLYMGDDIPDYEVLKRCGCHERRKEKWGDVLASKGTGPSMQREELRFLIAGR